MLPPGPAGPVDRYARDRARGGQGAGGSGSRVPARQPGRPGRRGAVPCGAYTCGRPRTGGWLCARPGLTGPDRAGPACTCRATWLTGRVSAGAGRGRRRQGVCWPGAPGQPGSGAGERRPAGPGPPPRGGPAGQAGRTAWWGVVSPGGCGRMEVASRVGRWSAGSAPSPSKPAGAAVGGAREAGGSCGRQAADRSDGSVWQHECKSRSSPASVRAVLRNNSVSTNEWAGRCRSTATSSRLPRRSPVLSVLARTLSWMKGPSP